MKIKNTNKKIKKIIPILILFVLLIPLFVGAQTPPAKESPIIPDCSPNCGYQDLLKLVNNIIKWIIMISVPVAAGVFAWAGFTYMTTGIVDRKAEAKSMINKVFIGFVFILSAWIIVNTITNTLLKDSFRDAVPVEGTKK